VGRTRSAGNLKKEIVVDVPYEKVSGGKREKKGKKERWNRHVSEGTGPGGERIRPRIFLAKLGRREHFKKRGKERRRGKRHFTRRAKIEQGSSEEILSVLQLKRRKSLQLSLPAQSYRGGWRVKERGRGGEIR